LGTPAFLSSLAAERVVQNVGRRERGREKGRARKSERCQARE